MVSLLISQISLFKSQISLFLYQIAAMLPISIFSFIALYCKTSFSNLPKPLRFNYKAMLFESFYYQ